MKRVFLLLAFAVVLLSFLVLPSFAAIRQGDYSEIDNRYVWGFLSNTISGDPNMYEVVLATSSAEVDNIQITLLPNHVYYLNGHKFISDENGWIPDGTLFTLPGNHQSYRVRQNFYQSSPDLPPCYGIYNVNQEHYLDVTIFIHVTVDSGENDPYADARDEGYQFGHELGYASGYSDGLKVGNSEGYDLGFQNGHDEGYIEGLAVAENGDWRSLITAVVEAPINTFQSLFNFNVLGLDMRIAFGSLMSLCVFLLVLKKVVM